jgi:hypothetical protein
LKRKIFFMINKTQNLKNLISQGESLANLKDFYKDERCHILLTGSSFGDYSLGDLKSRLQDKLVFCVKQTYCGLEEICDVHFWNCSNMPTNTEGIPYTYNPIIRPVVVASSNFERGVRWSFDQQLDFFIKIPLIEEVGKENCIAIKRNFDDFLLEENAPRTVGPGIMLETVLYFAVHLGVSEISTLGWDLNAHNSHFYNDKVSNKGCEIPWDMKANSDAVAPIFHWLKNKNINLTTFASSSSLNELVPRISL